MTMFSAVAEFVAVVLAVAALPVILALYLWLDSRERQR